MDGIVVSIICNTYNHEKYIARALDSFLEQETDFRYEILLHDDASTDNTKKVIDEYCKKNGKVIRPICQTENQYSKNSAIDLRFQFPRARGDFIAFCEGDDYWCDKRKLQKQVDALLKNPSINICTHASYIKKNGKTVGIISPNKFNSVIPVSEVIEGGGGFVATASIMIRRSVIDDISNFYSKYPFDYSLQIMGALNGGMLYLADYMSVYNILTENSWTMACSKNRGLAILWERKVLNMLQALKEEFPQVTKYVNKAEQVENAKLLFLEDDYRGIIFNRKYFNKLSLRNKIIILLGAVFGKKCIENIRILKKSIIAFLRR